MADSEYQGLDTLSSTKQAQGAAIERRNVAQFELADAIDQSREDVIGVQNQHHATKLQTMQQADNLAGESDAISQQVTRAQADPWHDVKVLFTDEKSISDLAADQNAVQGRMNSLNRKNVQDTYKYKFNLGQISQQIQSIQEKRKFALEDVQATAVQAQAVGARVQNEALLRNEQLDSFSFNELIELQQQVTTGERSDYPDWEVESKIREWVEAQDKAGAKKAKTNKELFDVYMDLIPHIQVTEALRTGKDLQFEVPGATGQTITLTQPMLQTAKHSQDKIFAERRKFVTENITSTMSSEIQMEQFSGAMERYAESFGVELYKRVPSGRNEDGSVKYAAELDFTKLPGTSSQQLATLTGINSMIDEREQRLFDQDPSAAIGGETTGLEPTAISQQEKVQMTEELRGLRKQRESLLTSMTDSVVEEAKKGYEAKSGKTSIESYIRTGTVNGRTADTRVALSETVANNAAIGAGFTPYSSGWAEGMQTLQLATMDGYQKATSSGDVTSLFTAGDDVPEEERQAALMKFIAGPDKKKPAQIQREALQRKNKSGENIHIKAIFNAWNKDTLAQAFELLKSKHQGETVTIDVLNTFMTARKNGYIQDRYTIPQEGMFNLMQDLANNSFVMQQQHAIDERVNLAGELYEILAGNEFYNTFSMQNLTASHSFDEELVAASLFQGQQHRAFMATMHTQMRTINIHNHTTRPAYGRDQDAHAIIQDIMKQRFQTSVPTTEEYNDVLFEYYETLRQKNPTIGKRGPTTRSSTLQIPR